MSSQNQMEDLRYEFLDRRDISIHKDQESEISAKALEEVSQFQRFRFYSREKMMAISREGRVQDEINKLVASILEERKANPEGSNAECAGMDFLMEFLSKLDLEDFRKVKIQGLADESITERSG